MQTITLGLNSEIGICRKVVFQKRFMLVIIAAIELYESPPIYSDEFRLPNSQKDLLLILSVLPFTSSLRKMDVTGQITVFRIIMVKIKII